MFGQADELRLACGGQDFWNTSWSLSTSIHSSFFSSLHHSITHTRKNSQCVNVDVPQLSAPFKCVCGDLVVF